PDRRRKLRRSRPPVSVAASAEASVLRRVVPWLRLTSTCVPSLRRVSGYAIKVLHVGGGWVIARAAPLWFSIVGGLRGRKRRSRGNCRARTKGEHPQEIAAGDSQIHTFAHGAIRVRRSGAALAVARLRSELSQQFAGLLCWACSVCVKLRGTE